MAVTVSLQDVVDAIELQSETTTAYLDPDSGEIIPITEDDRRYAEAKDDNQLPAWQREILPKVREVLASDRFLPLPSPFDIHEWDIMRRFSEASSNPRCRDELISAIHGAGAFRHFRDTIRWLGLEEQWYRFRRDALETIAKEWLAERGIQYK